VKPFEPSELLARVEALLRRVGKGELAPLVQFRFGDVDIDFQAGEVRKGALPVSLATKELELLRYLIERRSRAVSRDDLLKGVWQYQPGISSRTVDMHVAWLRQKLEDSPQDPRYIQTVRGVGYKFSC
jgi:two-component system alkaline phosphatase synthesis response regulator PhoP